MGIPGEAFMELSDLARRLSSGRLFHAYIITGADAGTRERAGNLIARAAVCQAERGVPCGACRDCVKAERGVHPDIETVRREKDAAFHNVEAMRALRARAAVVPNEARRGVHIIAEADLMNAQAQNAMLKILEEPPSHAVFILLADNPEMLLETVRSRCETVVLTPEEAVLEEKLVDTAAALTEAYLREDDLGLAKAVRALEKLSKPESFDLVTALRREALRRSGELTPARRKRLLDTLDTADRMVFANIKGNVLGGYLLAALCGTE